MSKYITHIDVSLDDADEQKLQSQGFKRINVDMNKGAGGKSIHLWYKYGSGPITKIQVAFNSDMAVGLVKAGYTKIPKNLNAGASGDVINLWYLRGKTGYDTPIVEIDVSADVHASASKFKNGWERLACNVNRGAGGYRVHIWVKREQQTYICDVTATDSYALDADNFKGGYIRVDEDTNRGAGGAYVFIWYRQTTDSTRALTNLQISIDDHQYQECQQQNYQPVSVNLNEGAGGEQVYMWHKKQEFTDPIKAIALLLDTAAADAYEKAGVNVIQRNLNAGHCGWKEYLCFYQ